MKLSFSALSSELLLTDAAREIWNTVVELARP